MKKIATMALMAIMIICSASTCTNGDDEYDGHIDNLLNLWDTSWQATHFWDYDMWVTPYDYAHRLTITFHNTTYEARYDGPTYDSNGQFISGQTSYYAGDCRVRDRYIYCYDGRSNDERLRFEVIRFNEFEMEAKVYLAKRNETVRVVLNRQ